MLVLLTAVSLVGTGASPGEEAHNSETAQTFSGNALLWPGLHTLSGDGMLLLAQQGLSRRLAVYG